MRDPRLHLWSSIGKKWFSGLTGIALMAFIVAHLGGNLTLFLGKDAFNGYAHGLHGFGWGLYAAELGLAAFFVFHAVTGIVVWLDRRRARSIHNTVVASKGPPSRKTLSSRSMILTGIVLLVFLVIHIWQFRLGPGESQGYVAYLHGEPVWDLHRVVVEQFANPLVVAGYMAVMVLLGFHLRHGFWSAFQSIGTLNPRLRPLAYSAGLVFAVVIAVGFFVLPLYVHFFGAGPAAGGVALLRP